MNPPPMVSVEGNKKRTSLGVGQFNSNGVELNIIGTHQQQGGEDDDQANNSTEPEEKVA